MPLVQRRRLAKRPNHKGRKGLRDRDRRNGFKAANSRCSRCPQRHQRQKLTSVIAPMQFPFKDEAKLDYRLHGCIQGKLKRGADKKFWLLTSFGELPLRYDTARVGKALHKQLENHPKANLFVYGYPRIGEDSKLFLFCACSFWESFESLLTTKAAGVVSP